MRKRGNANCLSCGIKLANKPTGRKRLYCSKECSENYRKQHLREDNYKNYKEKHRGGTAICAYCGIKFMRKENSIKTCCSNTCQQAKSRMSEVVKLNEMFFNDSKETSFIDVRAWAFKQMCKLTVQVKAVAVDSCRQLPSEIKAVQYQAEFVQFHLKTVQNFLETVQSKAQRL